MTAADIIAKFGGTSALARMLDLNASTVDSWKSWNQIPKWRQSKLLDLALEHSVPIRATDFPSASERRVRERRAA